MKSLYFQLFWREKHGVMLEVNGLPDLPSRLQEEFTQWSKNRRKIQAFEASLQTWVRIDEKGSSVHFTLQPNGTLIENNLFSDDSQTGHWKIVDGILLLKITDGDTMTDYQIVGNRLNNIHCGVATSSQDSSNGNSSRYSKFIQVQRSQ
ncbi:hypothetical protein [Vibrio nomapromontoriensis]|uniref:hypothetical protein n=1 Tax=Vibrio nomapromontoriensis TaxID=2910246 RepID=UPI003D12B4D7